MIKKLRIQKLSTNLEILDDRLVDQKTEFYSGPKEPHEGPLRIEFCLFEKEDIEKAKEYLDKLTGSLPIETKVSKKLKMDTPADDKDFVEDLMGVIRANDWTQEDLIKMLRKHDFRFMTGEFMGVLEIGTFISEKKKKDYQFMVRCLKEAKDPKNDKYDPRLIIGMKIVGERSRKVIAYVDELLETFSFDFKEELSSILVKPSEITVFPEMMTYEERERWRTENRKLSQNPTAEPSKFYTRWAKYVTTKVK